LTTFEYFFQFLKLKNMIFLFVFRKASLVPMCTKYYHLNNNFVLYKFGIWLLIFFLYFFKLKKIWLWLNLECEQNKNGGSKDFVSSWPQKMPYKKVYLAYLAFGSPQLAFLCSCKLKICRGNCTNQQVLGRMLHILWWPSTPLHVVVRKLLA
jgi:hypothetical protein